MNSHEVTTSCPLTRLSGGSIVGCGGVVQGLEIVYRMSRPRMTLMVLLVTAAGFAVGASGSADAGSNGLGLWGLFWATMVGTGLACVGAGVLNQVSERQTDGMMARTRGRPLPTGEISKQGAWVLGCVLAGGGVVVLGATSNLIAAAMCGLTIVSYNLGYTPLKRVSNVSTLVGAAPGAIPPVIGYAASAGRLDIEAWLMFAILYVWQLPHFLAIAWVYREQYARAGIAVLPVVDPQGDSTFRQIVVSSLILVPLALLPTQVGACGAVYFFVALVMGVCFLAVAGMLAVTRSQRLAKALFYVSLVYLPLVYGFMVLDRV